MLRFKWLTLTVAMLVCGLIGHPTRGTQDHESVTGGREKSEEIHLAGMTPLRQTGAWEHGSCMLDGDTYDNSIRQWPGELVYSLPKGEYILFKASVGVDDTCTDRDLSATFTVYGDNKPLSTKTARVDQKPQDIEVSVKGISKLTLNVSIKTSRRMGKPVTWWGNARLVKGDSSDPPDGPGGSGGTMLRLDSDKLDILSAKLAAKVAVECPEFSKSRPLLAVAAFKLVSNRKLSSANVEAIREYLSVGFSNSKEVSVVERSQLDTLLKSKKIELADTFDSDAVKELGKLARAQLIVIGSIIDGGTYVDVIARVLETVKGKALLGDKIRLQQ
jgi:TolB-like protein